MFFQRGHVAGKCRECCRAWHCFCCLLHALFLALSSWDMKVYQATIKVLGCLQKAGSWRLPVSKYVDIDNRRGLEDVYSEGLVLSPFGRKGFVRHRIVPMTLWRHFSLAIPGASGNDSRNEHFGSQQSAKADQVTCECIGFPAPS